MAIDTKSLTQIITEFRALQSKDAVSPESLGDIDKANGRKRKRWFSRKYFASGIPLVSGKLNVERKCRSLAGLFANIVRKHFANILR